MGEQRYRLSDKGRILLLVQQLMDWPSEKAERWYRTRNPLLGNGSPLRLVRQGRAHKVLAFIHAAIDEAGPKERSRG